MLYGVRRTLAKTLYKFEGNFSYFFLKLMYSSLYTRDSRIVIVGLGNHGFTLIAFFIAVVARHRISMVVDPSEKSKDLANKVLKCQHFSTIDEAIEAKSFFGDIIYICSDHFSHTHQANIATKCFKSVYIEKPLFVNFDQMASFATIQESGCNIYTGFNRPHAPFFKEFASSLGNEFSVTMVINGHFLSEDHWYRLDSQGSRVLGNLTHWLDLAVRLLSKDDLSNNVEIILSPGYLDDLLVILTLGSKKVSLSFSANCEPNNGVEEFIFWNSTESIGSINNFRKLNYLTQNGKIRKIHTFKKDVGHQTAALAPIYGVKQDQNIPYVSSALALKVEDMYINGVHTAEFNLDL